MKSMTLLLVAIVMASAVNAASNLPLSGTWNIAPSGSAGSSGELLFRMTPGDGGDPVEVTVSVTSGTNDWASRATSVRRSARSWRETGSTCVSAKVPTCSSLTHVADRRSRSS